MATLAHGAVTSSDQQFRVGYSARLLREAIIENPLNRILVENGVINVENDLSVSKGGTVTMYNALKINGKGFTGDVDVYSNAQLLESSSRQMNIALNTAPVLTFPMQGTQSNQNAPFSIDEHKVAQLRDWAMALYSVGILNQAGGNTATSITQPVLDTASAFSASADLLRVTGNNAAIVPTRWYAGNGGGVITTDASVSSSNKLTIEDFQLAAEILSSQPSAGPAWQGVGGSRLGIVVIGMAGFNQLLNEAKTTEQGFQLSQLYRAEMQAGKSVGASIQTFEIPGVPFQFVIVPDTWLPRGVNTSNGAEVANTRRCIIMGRNALDLSFGKGFAPAGGKAIPGFNIEVDTDFKKLNNMGYAKASLLWGCKKTQSTGAGTGNSTAYDLSTYVITHYARA